MGLQGLSLATIAASVFLVPAIALADPAYPRQDIDWDMLEERYGGSTERSGCMRAPSENHEGNFVLSLNENTSLSIEGASVTLQFSFHTKNYSKPSCQRGTKLHGDIPEAFSGLGDFDF